MRSVILSGTMDITSARYMLDEEPGSSVSIQWGRQRGRAKVTQAGIACVTTLTECTVSAVVHVSTTRGGTLSAASLRAVAVLAEMLGLKTEDWG